MSFPAYIFYTEDPEGPENIHIHGPGLLPGLLSTFDGTFYVDTNRAGKGSCSVKIKGPRGKYLL